MTILDLIEFDKQFNVPVIGTDEAGRGPGAGGVFAAAVQFGIFDGIYELSGIVQSFAKRCIKGGLIKTLYDHCFSIDDVTCFDINSSYGTSMKYMQGIPIGKPKIFNDSIPNDSCYSLIQCEISNIRNDKLGRFSFMFRWCYLLMVFAFDMLKNNSPPSMVCQIAGTQMVCVL